MSASPRARAGLRNPREIKAEINALNRAYINAETNFFFSNTRYASGEWRRFVNGYERNKNRLFKELEKSLKAPRASKIIQRKFKYMYYEPHNKSPYNPSPLRGRGYRRAVSSVKKSVMSPKSRAKANLKNKLGRLLRAYQTGQYNRLNNMYANMRTNFNATGRSENAKRIINAANTIMAVIPR